MTPVSTIGAAKRTRATKQVDPQLSDLSLRSFLALDRQTLGFSLLLFAAVLAFYSSITHNGFIGYDDPGYISENVPVKAGLTWDTVVWAFTNHDYASNYHPLTWLSHAVDCDLFGLSPVGPHWENVVLHGLSAVLLFWTLRIATGFRWRSLMVAALFALHPINVESVAWAAERKNVLSTFLVLLALLAYVWYARKPGAGRYASVAALFTLALLAKPQVITFPFLLMLLDYWPLGRVRGTVTPAAAGGGFAQSAVESLVWEKMPLLALSAASAVLTVVAQSAGGAVRDLAHYGMILRIENAAIAYVRYVGKAFWPAALVQLYPHPTKLFPLWQIGGAVLLLGLITGAACARWRKQRYLAVGWFWFLGSLVPMIGLVQVGEQAMADRYAYLSFVGLFVMTVWLIADLTKAARIPTKWIAVPAVGWLLVLGLLTYRQVTYWHDDEHFWPRDIALTSGNYVAEFNYASFLHGQGRNEEAAQHLRAAVAINPNDLMSNLFLGADEGHRGNFAGALERFQFVATHAVGQKLVAQANDEIASVYRVTGDRAKAKQYYEASLRAFPIQPSIMVRLGVIALQDGDARGAAHQFLHAAALQPSEVADLLAAQALQQEGRTDEASKLFQRVASTSRNLAQTQKEAAALLAGK
jgi:tetratricopeptide (TPR) repeat protein